MVDASRRVTALRGARCNVASGQCLCLSDEACADGSFCNSVGICQIRSGCARNQDCASEPGTYCDLASGQCLCPEFDTDGTCIQASTVELASSCGASVHCPPGSVCTDGRCVEGCFDSGDCQLGEICSDGVCFGEEGICENNDFCEYGELCSGNACENDGRGPYCRGCTQRTVQNPEPCDRPRNFCLNNSLENGGFNQICGVDCSLGQPCPSGYQCSGVVILTDDECASNGQCQCPSQDLSLATQTCTVSLACDPKLPDGSPDNDTTFCVDEGLAACNGGTEGGEGACIRVRGETEGQCTCVEDDDCAEGSTCVSGACCAGPVREDRACAVGEGRVSGFCTCAVDSDCPQDSCDGSRGACALSGQPCVPGENSCPPISCVDGGCLIGQNCAPEQGLTCTTLGSN